MQSNSEHKARWSSKPWRLAAWLTAAALMLMPIAVQLTHGPFGWSIGDFAFIAIILLSGSAIFDLTARRAPSFSYLAAAGAALAASFGLIVVNGAVGLVGSEDEVHNLFFFGVLAVAILGSILARGRPVAMAKAMLAAAGAHIAVSTALLIAADKVRNEGQQIEVIGLSVFALLWLASSWLFWRSSTH